MAIYILLQCCKCQSRIRLHLYSFSKNKYDIYSQLCEHFNIRYSYTAKYGFFSLGWSINLEVKVQCRNCNNKYYNFGNNTFNADYYEYNNDHSCCYNVFIVSVAGNTYSTDGKGLLLQAKQRELEEKFKKEKEKERIEEEKRRRKIKERLEIQRKKEERMLKKLKIKNEIERQKEEEKKLNQLCNFDISYMDSEIDNLLISADYKLNSELNFDIEEKLKEKYDFKLTKFEFK